MINYPHPLLKSGLVDLVHPGLNALGTEPELTLKMIPERARHPVPARDRHRRHQVRLWRSGSATCRPIRRGASRC
jgi:hypothetical protein